MAIRRNGLALTVLLIRATFATPFLRSLPVSMNKEGLEASSPEFGYHLAISIVLVLAGGLFAGYALIVQLTMITTSRLFLLYRLTLGLMGLDELHLRVLAKSSQDLTEKRNAQTVLNLLRRGRHWVLVVSCWFCIFMFRPSLNCSY